MHFPSKVLFLHLVKLWRGAPVGGIFFVLPCNYPYSATIIRPQNTTLAKASPHFIHALVKGGRKIYLRKLFLKENSQICRGERFINIKTDQTDHDQISRLRIPSLQRTNRFVEWSYLLVACALETD
jgi:hypothetical protein